MEQTQGQNASSSVSQTGENQKKGHRRKHHEVERLFDSNYLGYKKSEGRLQSLNVQVENKIMHEPKRDQSESKEILQMYAGTL